MAHYIHDEKNNRIEGLSKSEIYALIDEVIESGELPTDDQEAFVTQIKSIVDANAYKIGFCTQAQYNTMESEGTLEANALYIITDDDSYDDIVDYIDQINSDITDLQNDVGDLSSDKVDVTASNAYYTQTINNTSGSGIILKTLDTTYQEYSQINVSNDDIYFTYYYPSSSNSQTVGFFDKLADIEERLDELGFKSGVSTYTGLTLASGATLTNTLTKQGKYCIFNLYGGTLTDYIGPSSLDWTVNTQVTITIPSDFIPKQNTIICVGAYTQIPATATVTTSGTITFTPTANGQFCILNAAWELD